MQAHTLTHTHPQAHLLSHLSVLLTCFYSLSLTFPPPHSLCLPELMSFQTKQNVTRLGNSSGSRCCLVLSLSLSLRYPSQLVPHTLLSPPFADLCPATLPPSLSAAHFSVAAPSLPSPIQQHSFCPPPLHRS